MGVEDSRLAARFERIGSNYKMSNLLAAVGLGQMEHVEAMLERRLRLAENYLRLLRSHPQVVIPATTRGGKHSRQSFCVYIEGRDAVMTRMREQGVEVQIGTYALHLHPAFAESPNCRYVGDLSSSRYAFDHCLTLPLYHEMSEDDQEYVVDMLAETMRECQ
jgi:dTDP-4-amino-4,6-dideoxygalactose transaminase